ncbi:MAG: efflux RND transporter periplasmic adaptor subunit [Planctomycetales bacterium]
MAAWGLATVGCQKAPPKTVAAKPPEVVYATPVEQTVTDSEEFIGRTAAVETVDVRARVSGYLEKVHFKDGADVKAGDLLFEIDSRSFKAEAERAAASVAQIQARIDRVSKQYERAVQLRGSKTITQEEFEAIQFDKADAAAALEGAIASQKLADLNLSYTRVLAPLSGRLSRRLVDVGNLVQADTTILANIVSINPIHAYFDVDERTVLRLRRLIQEGKIQSARNSQITCRIALADEKDFALSGVINFVDNQIEASSGTLRVRVVIDNPKQLLSPGFFVRVQVPIGVPHKALLVQEEALGTDQGQRYVYVINDKDEVKYQRVSIGALVDGKRVIDQGVSLNDRIIVTGLQRVRPGIKVTPKPYEVSSTAKKDDTTKPPAGKLASNGKDH